MEQQKSSRDSLQYSSGYSTQTNTPSCSEDTIPSQDYNCYLPHAFHQARCEAHAFQRQAHPHPATHRARHRALCRGTSHHRCPRVVAAVVIQATLVPAFFCLPVRVGSEECVFFAGEEAHGALDYVKTSPKRLSLSNMAEDVGRKRQIRDGDLAVALAVAVTAKRDGDRALAVAVSSPLNKLPAQAATHRLPALILIQLEPEPEPGGQ
ncbi:hypothetical protein NHX12_005153 [Muraenolepis orangiensis]|uniref:Uncharacterized protein n=1 Tax=Muraenolepis orangiensis TaxID=630683 RepID=A0A9Q0DQU7_9TELE|nr:hypothetical protein NHX12_005153 [Muraenolepis orangiensis]